MQTGLELWLLPNAWGEREMRKLKWRQEDTGCSALSAIVTIGRLARVMAALRCPAGLLTGEAEDKKWLQACKPCESCHGKFRIYKDDFAVPWYIAWLLVGVVPLWLSNGSVFQASSVRGSYPLLKDQRRWQPRRPEKAHLTLGLTLEMTLLPFCPLTPVLQLEIKALTEILREVQHNKSDVARNCQYVKYLYCCEQHVSCGWKLAFMISVEWISPLQ